MPGSEAERIGLQLHLVLALDDEIHAVAGLAAAHDDGAGRVVARAQQPRHLGDQRGPDVVEKRYLGDELPGAQKLAPTQLLGIAVDDDAGPQRKDQNAADHDDAGGGTTSPYPVVVIVTIPHQSAIGIEAKASGFSGWAWRSSR